jgi:hypothetical protein
MKDGNDDYVSINLDPSVMQKEEAMRNKFSLKYNI